MVWRRHGGVDIACDASKGMLRLRVRVCMGDAGKLRLVATGVHSGQVVRAVTSAGKMRVTPTSAAGLVKSCIRQSAHVLTQELDRYVRSFPVECQSVLDARDVTRVLARP